MRTPKNALNFASSIPHRSPPLLYYHLVVQLLIPFLLANCIHTWCFVWRQVANHIFPKMQTLLKFDTISSLNAFRAKSGFALLDWVSNENILMTSSLPQYFYKGQLLSVFMNMPLKVFLLLNAIWWANSLRK